MGDIIGHEMGHAFDVSGIRYGKDGKSTEISINVLKNYYQRAECFTDQFLGYYGETRPPPQSTTDDYDYMVCSYFIFIDQFKFTREFYCGFLSLFFFRDLSQAFGLVEPEQKIWQILLEFKRSLRLGGNRTRSRAA